MTGAENSRRGKMKVNVDVMTHGGERFYRTVRYEHNPLFRMDMKEVEDYVYRKCPTLKGEKGVVLVIDN